ncbi:uncharacterized protein LOC105845998 [Hydra vulgaris]|uniref:uncharacterized protein LOC105845998 n=1 Tax=Hydra vulgaris TaxID=6087 RepID=UPI001F5E9451|nr:uncharacterized protein LOC105845998 [Hydra vulgaris]
MKYEHNLVKQSKSNTKCIYSYINSKTKIKNTIRAIRDINRNVTTNDIAKAHPRVLKEFSQSLCKPLELMFNQSFESSTLPNLWLHANITPLHKKNDILESANYRPISLTFIICKVMESVVRDEIMKHLNNSDLILVHQHGTVNKKNCCTNLLETLDIVSEAFDNNILVEIIFLDFAKAFDTALHERLCIKLAGYGIIVDLLNWCRAFLKNWLQRVVLGENISKWTNNISGVP